MMLFVQIYINIANWNKWKCFLINWVDEKLWEGFLVEKTKKYIKKKKIVLLLTVEIKDNRTELISNVGGHNGDRMYGNFG